MVDSSGVVPPLRCRNKCEVSNLHNDISSQPLLCSFQSNYELICVEWYLKLWEVIPHERCKRQVPTALNPALMMEEKNEATIKRLENPPLCECRDLAMVDSSGVVPPLDVTTSVK